MMDVMCKIFISINLTNAVMPIGGGGTNCAKSREDSSCWAMPSVDQNKPYSQEWCDLG